MAMHPSTTTSPADKTPKSAKTSESQAPATAQRRPFTDPEIAEDRAWRAMFARRKARKLKNLTPEQEVEAARKGE